MFIGIEYVVATYVIWLVTFVVYIFLTKHRLKTTNDAVSLLEKRVTEKSSGVQDSKII
ncbi:MAG: hypothetical protein VX485_08190 [SAR324 cluster bacterium]|nr:hypothetical protein [SAR324 cluster bacterium]MED6340548.1 hypothetical protein [SAR324 cluster bacterium]